MLSHIAAEEEDNVPGAPNKVRCDQAKWKEIGGLALCDEDCNNKINDPILNLTLENITQHSGIE